MGEEPNLICNYNLFQIVFQPHLAQLLKSAYILCYVFLFDGSAMVGHV